jgi:carbon starvation protein CstA
MNKNYWITLLPALFMTMVTTTYLIVAPEGFRLPLNYGYAIGFITTTSLLLCFAYWATKLRKTESIKVNSNK